MFLKKLSIVNYKNIESNHFEFSQKINSFVGNNGVGKTNLLDAIYHLGMGKSYFNPSSLQNIKHGSEFYLLEGDFLCNQKPESIVCSLRKGQRKQIKRNGKNYNKLTEHIGSFPIVIVSPSDRDLITEGSDERRKFLDSVISLSDNAYLNALMSYNRALAQRNSLLKYFAENQSFDQDTLSIYNDQLCLWGEQIHLKRKTFLENFTSIFQQQYKIISNENEKVEIIYQSSLFDKDMNQILSETQNKDLIYQYTTQGVHKDDIIFNIENQPIKKYGSQGQQKSFLIALKFAQFHIIRTTTKITPILLLDDIFDKLDAQRVQQIINLVSEDDFGQIFISDTHVERTEQIIKSVFTQYKMFEIKKQ